ncbi:MAG TPA: hypothetical protein VFC03_11660, partial [Acidimicrobiales bacterium]|nr:hypothetical protein [Acidimicrobiales bacterium]
VRMILVPSVMELLGNLNWWMPKWLDRVVPNLGIEVDVDEPGDGGASQRAHQPGEHRLAAGSTSASGS